MAPESGETAGHVCTGTNPKRNLNGPHPPVNGKGDAARPGWGFYEVSVMLANVFISRDVPRRVTEIQMMLLIFLKKPVWLYSTSTHNKPRAKPEKPGPAVGRARSHKAMSHRAARGSSRRRHRFGKLAVSSETDAHPPRPWAAVTKEK